MNSDLPSTAGIKAPLTRRSYLGWLIGLCTAAAGAALFVPLIRFVLYPVTAQTTEKEWSDAGPVSDFDSVRIPVQRSLTVQEKDGWRETMTDKSIYMTKDSAGRLSVLSAICPHLGCSVQWVDSERRFNCPCHGASFSREGTRLGGPAPRGMDTLETAIRDGHVMVRYQYFRQLLPTKEVIG